MSLLLSLLLTSSLGAMPDATADPASIQAPTVGKKNRRPSRKPSPKAPPPETPPMEDLPLGAQDLLMTNAGASSNPSAGTPNRPSAQPPTDNDGSGVSPTSAESSEDGEPSDDEERLSSEAAWRIAVDEAREKLRAAEEERRQQGSAAGNDAALRVAKARQRLTRLLEKGRAKQYRELPKPVELEP